MNRLLSAPVGARLERFAAGAIIAVALAMALVWVFRVPLFQAPDENTHADYAFTLYTLGGPLVARDKATGTDVHPLVRYLEDASGFRSIRFNFDGRAVPGYGTAEFYRAVDAKAPKVLPNFLDRPGARVPWVARQYAYFYYALDAIAIGIGALVSGGSPVAEFFAARIFNVVLLGFSLVLTYLTMREMRIRTPFALALLAAIGWFPLTSWVSAYVQPDNLAFTAIALVFYVSVRLRREPADLRAAALVGVALGLLAMTKPQYFIAAAIPALADRTVRFAATHRAFPMWVAYAALSLGPAIVLGLSGLAISAGVEHQVAAIVVANGNPLATAAAHGPGALLGYLWTALHDAWASIFRDGLPFISFWGAFSWTGYRITIVTPGLTQFLFDVIGWISAAVFAAIFFRTLSVWGKLGRVARTRGIAVALRVLCGDVPLNTYLLFVALILGIMVSTGGQIGTQGRYWLPLMLPTVLCATRYVLRLRRNRFDRSVATAFCVGWLLYSIAGSGAALAALNARFYDPPVATTGDEFLSRITSFGTHRLDRQIVLEGDRVYTSAGRPRIEGWALDSRSGLPAQRVDFVIDGRRRIPVKYGLAWPEVVGRFHDDSFLHSGFSGRLDLRGLGAGPHELRLEIWERSRAQPYPSRARVAFRIGPR